MNTQQDVLLHNECQQLKNTDTLSGMSQVAVREDQREISPEKKTDGSDARENDLEKASSETDRKEAGRYSFEREVQAENAREPIEEQPSFMRMAVKLIADKNAPSQTEEQSVTITEERLRGSWAFASDVESNSDFRAQPSVRDVPTNGRVREERSPRGESKVLRSPLGRESRLSGKTREETPLTFSPSVQTEISVTGKPL